MLGCGPKRRKDPSGNQTRRGCCERSAAASQLSRISTSLTSIKQKPRLRRSYIASSTTADRANGTSVRVIPTNEILMTCSRGDGAISASSRARARRPCCCPHPSWLCKTDCRRMFIGCFLLLCLEAFGQDFFLSSEEHTSEL